MLGVALLPLLMSIPAACACYVMGGLSVGDLLRLYGVLVMLTIQLTVIALWISSFSESTDAALRTTYGVVFLLTVVTPGPYQFVHSRRLANDDFGDRNAAGGSSTHHDVHRERSFVLRRTYAPLR